MTQDSRPTGRDVSLIELQKNALEFNGDIVGNGKESHDLDFQAVNVSDSITAKDGDGSALKPHRLSVRHASRVIKRRSQIFIQEPSRFSVRMLSDSNGAERNYLQPI
mmetsp:Transcript_11741/g.19095  ORF Transcript_11741/g.19095 Transcript_11741/m.19095 type:complete len:107 (+) Transcript_11741:3-323(+)